MQLKYVWNNIHKTRNHWMSWIFTCWAWKSPNQSEIHLFSQAPYHNNLAQNSLKPGFHWNNEGQIYFIRPFYFVWCSLPETRLGYYEKQPLLTERGPHSFKKGLFQLKGLPYNNLYPFLSVWPKLYKIMMTFSHLSMLLLFDKILLICKRSKLNESGFTHRKCPPLK